MLSLVAYDIADHKRLARVARVCEDFGVRVQYSIFECRLEEPDFDDFWLQLLEIINAQEDRLVAYKIDARCAKETLTAGTMVCSEKVVCYWYEPENRSRPAGGCDAPSQKGAGDALVATWLGIASGV